MGCLFLEIRLDGLKRLENKVRDVLVLYPGTRPVPLDLTKAFVTCCFHTDVIPHLAFWTWLIHVKCLRVLFSRISTVFPRLGVT